MKFKITNKVQKKYQFEPILKEMWVGYEKDGSDSQKAFVLGKARLIFDKDNLGFICISKDGEVLGFYNAWDKDPREQEKPNKDELIGKVGYFWDDVRDNYVSYSRLTCISTDDEYPYTSLDDIEYKHFSLTPPKLNF